MKFVTKNEKDLEKVVNHILPIIKTKPLFLIGELGSGKTTLVKKIGESLGINEIIKSPSFNKMNVYDKLIHIDAYNLKGDLEEYEDYFEDKIVIIEWANNIKHNFKHYLLIEVSMNNDLHIFTVKEDI